MSSHAISSSFRYVEPNVVPVDPRLQTNANEGNSCWSTALKVAGMIAAIIVSIGSFVVLGPLAGFLVTLILGTAALSFNRWRHHHSHPNAIPWHQRLFSLLPQHGFASSHHVPVGQGHMHPSHTWWPWPSFTSSGVQPIHQHHVPVGGGHESGGHVAVGGGHDRRNAPVYRERDSQGFPSPTGRFNVPVGGGHWR